MERRLFLQSLLATAALDPERLLWVPQKKFFIPPARRSMIIDMDWGRELATDMEPYSLPPQFLQSWADFIDRQAADFAYLRVK